MATFMDEDPRGLFSCLKHHHRYRPLSDEALLGDGPVGDAYLLKLLYQARSLAMPYLWTYLWAIPYLWAKGCAYFWAVPYIGKYTNVEATTQVVSIGHLIAFYVVLVPMEIN